MCSFFKSFWNTAKWFCENGFQVHIYHALLLWQTRNVYFASSTAFFLHYVNYYFWFHEPRLNIMEEMAGLQLLGHVAALYYSILPESYSLVLVVQTSICLGYWLRVVSPEQPPRPPMLYWHWKLCNTMQHSLPLLLLVVSETRRHNYQSILLVTTHCVGVPILLVGAIAMQEYRNWALRNPTHGRY